MSVQFDPVVPPAPGDGSGPAAAGSFRPLLALLAWCHPQQPGAALPVRPRLVMFGADHGIAAAEVSAHLPADTARRLTDLAAGAGPVATMAAGAGVGVRVVDLRTPAGSEARHAHPPVDTQAFGGFVPSGRIDVEDAMTEVELLEAVQAGRQAADTEVDEGADLLTGAVCGVGVSTPTAVLVAAISGMEPVDATSRGSGISDAAWIRKAAAVRDALYRARLAGTDAVTLLRVAGGRDLAALTGFLAQAAVRRTPVLIDDVASAACAVLAHRLAPGADAYVVAAAVASDRGHRRMLDVLGRDPLTAWSLRLGGGTGAMLTVQAARAIAAAAANLDDRGRTPDAIDSWDPDLL